MRERYKDKPQEMQQEMMRIYKEEKVNPLGGCLPHPGADPGVHRAVLGAAVVGGDAQRAWIGWIRDLSTPDPYFILPVVMTVTSLLQTALNPVPPDPMQAKMMWFMPLAFSRDVLLLPGRPGAVLDHQQHRCRSPQQWLINRAHGRSAGVQLPKFRQGCRRQSGR